MIKAGDWWNRTQVVRRDASSYNRVIIIKPEIRGKTRWKQTWQNIQWTIGWHLLLLLLILPRCLDMWTSIPAHIYPHLSGARLLLKTNRGINEQCLQWSRAYPRPRPRMFYYWCIEPITRRVGGSYRMPFMRWYQEGGSQRSTRSPGGS